MNATIVVTDAGIQEIINAEATGTAPVVLSQVGFGTGQYTPTHDQTSLNNEFKRLNANALQGGSIGDNTIYVNARDESNDAYTLYEFGIYTESGTLFAVCSQTVPILQKAAGAHAYLDIEFLLTNVDPTSVTLGDTNFFNPSATSEREGVVELATNEETIAGSDSTRAVTPAGLNGRTATENRAGLAQFATSAESLAGSINTKAVTPAGLTASFPKIHSTHGYQKLPNGLMVQWGQALIPNGSTGLPVILPTAFPNKITSVQITGTGNVQASYNVSFSDSDKGKFSVIHDGNGGVNVSWLAIGY